MATPMVPNLMADDKTDGGGTTPQSQGKNVRVDDHELPSEQLCGKRVQDTARLDDINGRPIGQAQQVRMSRHHLVQERELSFTNEHAAATKASKRDGVRNKAGQYQDRGVEDDRDGRGGVRKHEQD